MQLTQFSDYAMRTVLYLGSHPRKLVSVGEISRAYGISRHHLVKVVQRLTELGVVRAQRGRGGGMQLAMDPSAINVGWLIRQTEPHFNMVECFDPMVNRCPIASACGLNEALDRATHAFLDVLSEYSLDRFLKRRTELASLLGGALKQRADGASEPAS
jgi:Rrf2 family nitric oxide-sensitive transcriptional repressor